MPISESLFQSTVDRSWTNIFSGTSYLSGVDPSSVVGHLLAQCRTPKTVLPTLLHESTHHWCVFSLLGTTVAMMQARARLRTLALARDPLDVDAEVFAAVSRDRLRVKTVMTMLEPLAEGLALFMEFDASPGDSEMISSPMYFTRTFFGEEKLTKDETPGEISNTICDILWETRMSGYCARRKEQLLSQPLSFKSGGYLPGYLTVKSLYVEAVKRAKAFDDSHLFACYVKSFFYDDCGLISLLLDQDIADDEWVQRVAEYLKGRFIDLRTCDIGRDVERYERFYARQPLDLSEEHRIIPLGEKRELFEHGVHLYRDLKAEFIIPYHHFYWRKIRNFFWRKDYKANLKVPLQQTHQA